jgi:large subunit ribosomal protein L6
MSRIGKKPIAVPTGVTVTLQGQNLKVKGPKGELSFDIIEDVEVIHEGSELLVKPKSDTKRAKSMWGMCRTQISNMVEGVTKGFEKSLELNGVGYRASMKGSVLVLQLGYSHDIDYPAPDGIKIDAPKQTEIKIMGIDKQKVGQVAAEIRRYRSPEPYKGKGVKYAGEKIRRKEGKKK